MSFDKAEQLLELREMVASRRLGVTLDEVVERFGISLRTAQRMLAKLETKFGEVASGLCADGRKRWRIDPAAGVDAREPLTFAAEDLAALGRAIAAAQREGATAEARSLERVRDKLVALIPGRRLSRIEPDLEALLEAQGVVARPGPRPKLDEAVSQAIAHAIKGCLVLDILYRSHRDAGYLSRLVMPYGVLTGLRRYLVARPVDDPDGPVRCYRLDAVKSASVTNTGFSRPDGFDLQAFANRAFGVYQTPEEIGEVVWQFVPAAAEHARGFQFHPDQVMEDQPDGSLVVRFTAAGHLEMAWHLYTWGDKVEVLAQPALRAMVDGHRRTDFPAMP